MDRRTDDLYLRYCVARLAAYHNVWWSFANEYDLMREKTEADWDHYGPYVQALDPHGHLRSIHNCRGFYNHAKPWVTHCSVQSSDIPLIPKWIADYQKPIVIDECCYEGNIPNSWGSLTGWEMTARSGASPWHIRIRRRKQRCGMRSGTGSQRQADRWMVSPTGANPRSSRSMTSTALRSPRN
jgi:hypothetical protein